VATVFASGAQIDRYTILRHVATGGMGSVWQGELSGKHGFAKKVAIKAIKDDFAAEASFKDMFLEEARISSRLSHANVAQVLDVGEHEGTVYIVFEWVDGRSLEGICRDAAARSEGVSLELALRILADVCAGLHALHELRDDKGALLHAVHRDVTPNNVLVSREGFAKIIDFGLAKARDRAIAATKSGVIKGTPAFMAPEQAMGQAVDRRSDVFSAGAVLYRVLAGRPPFPDSDALASFVLGKPPAELPARVPEAVRALIEKAMACDPEDRFATAAEMRRALERATHLDLEGARPELPAPFEEEPPEQREPLPPTIAARPAMEVFVPVTSTVLAPPPPSVDARQRATEPSPEPPQRAAPGSRWLVLALAVAAGLVAVSLWLALRS
jgi:serine/threonine-protein kinase